MDNTNRPFRWVERLSDNVFTLIAADTSKCGWVAKQPVGSLWKWEAFIGCDVNGYDDSSDGTSESLEDAQEQVLKFCGLLK